MKHAFLIIAHNDFPVLHTLLNMLDDTGNDLFVHIDLRATDIYKQVCSVSTKQARLFILPNRISVHWGDISQVEVEYLLLETAAAKEKYAYYHLLSGADLPIQSQEYIHRFFQHHNGKEFIGFWQTPAHLKDLDRKISRYYFFTKHRRPGEKWHELTTPLYNISLILQKIIGIHRKQEVAFQKGPQWFSITDDFCHYLIGQKEAVLQRMNHTLCPDEIFVQTVIWNSPFKDRLFNLDDENIGSMRLIDWKRGNPYVWTSHDYSELAQSDKLFARKFSSQDAAIIEKIEKLCAERVNSKISH